MIAHSVVSQTSKCNPVHLDPTSVILQRNFYYFSLLVYLKFSFCFAFFSIVSFNSSNLLLISWSFSSQSSGRANVSLALKYQTPGPVAFTLNGSRLVTTRKLNFETQDSYKVTVVATDSGNPPLNTSLTFTIQVKKNPP